LEIWNLNGLSGTPEPGVFGKKNFSDVTNGF